MERAKGQAQRDTKERLEEEKIKEGRTTGGMSEVDGDWLFPILPSSADIVLCIPVSSAANNCQESQSLIFWYLDSSVVGWRW